MPSNIWSDSGFGDNGSIGGLMSATFGLPSYGTAEATEGDSMANTGYGGFGDDGVDESSQGFGYDSWY